MRYRKAIFIVVYAKSKEKKKRIEYLILKRKLHWKGWEFPKGGLNFFESRRASVKRELLEETGLKPKGKIKKFDFSGKYDYKKIFPDRPGIKGQKFSLYAVEVEKPKDGKVNLGYEHSDYKWVAFSAALRLLKWPNQKKSLKIVNDWLESKGKQKSLKIGV